MFFADFRHCQEVGDWPSDAWQPSKSAAEIVKMTVLEDYWELGELLTIRYGANDLYG